MLGSAAKSNGMCRARRGGVSSGVNAGEGVRPPEGVSRRTGASANFPFS
jgi:hypothetical protein